MQVAGSSGAGCHAGIRIPRSSARPVRNDFAKLLKHVDPDADCGFGFEGTILRPGTTIAHLELWPTDEYPRVPVLLECAVVPREEPRAQRRMEQLYVLWRYDERESWVELGRARSESWEWAVELRGLAVRALAESRPVLRYRINLRDVQERVTATLDRELNGLDFGERRCVLGILHDQLAWRAAALAMAPVEKEAVYVDGFLGNGACLDEKAVYYKNGE